MLQVQCFAKLSAQIPTAVGLEPDQDIMRLLLDLPIEVTQSTSMEEHLHRKRGRDKEAKWHYIITVGKSG